MFYFALITTTLALIPGLIGLTLGRVFDLPASFMWIMPSWTEMALLIITGALGIIGQGMFTHGVGLGETSFVMPFDYMRIVCAFNRPDMVLRNTWSLVLYWRRNNHCQQSLSLEN